MHNENYLIKSDTLEDIADAIREKKESEELIAVEDFATEIENLPSGGAIVVTSLSELNSSILACLNSFNDYASEIAKNYPVDTAEAVTLYTPNANNKIYAIRKRPSGLYQAMWFPATLIVLSSTDTAGFETKYCAVRTLGTKTGFCNNVEYYFAGDSPQTYLSQEYNTLGEAIDALKSNTTSYTVTTSYSSWGAYRYSAEYYLPYCNWLILNQNSQSETSQKISSNETIVVIE